MKKNGNRPADANLIHARFNKCARDDLSCEQRTKRVLDFSEMSVPTVVISLSEIRDNERGSPKGNNRSPNDRELRA